LSLRQDIQQRSKRHQTIIAWLSARDYSAQQNDFMSRREAGTGQQLLDSAEIRTWLNSGGQTLFCSGIPGAGKTMMTCIVIEDLLQKFCTYQDVGIAYVYSDYRQHQDQTPQEFLLGILRQLVQRQSIIPEEVQMLYDKFDAIGSRHQCGKIRDTLYSVVKLLSRTFVLVDALDECHSSHEGRWKIVSEIIQLGKKTNANIFATSRPVPEIASLFEGSLHKEIAAVEEDVLKYLDGRMLSLLRRRIWKHPQLQCDIRSTVVKRVDGM
jgi:hypothetical protein